LEAVLDEHRTPENMREVWAMLRKMAMNWDTQAMRLYLDRVLGPPRAPDDDEEAESDISQVPLEELMRLARRGR
jgi:hypothetical protein